MSDAIEKARKFLTEETAFRLGELPTEASHPKTKTLSQTAQVDLPAAIYMLQSVDAEIPAVAKKVFREGVFQTLIEDVIQTLKTGSRIYITGCGATGRLAILLETAWRRFWQQFQSEHPDALSKSQDLSDHIVSVMAGGDFALIKSVEGFEDFPAFGRYQLRQAGVKPGDIVIAVTEGGETSFVIGTAWEGLDAGAKVFFVYNNPTQVLCRCIQRSREVLEEPRVHKIELATGPMAITGSTRMQAVTIELLVLGAALEIALSRLVTDCFSMTPSLALKTTIQPAENYSELFIKLLARFSSIQAVDAMSRAILFEENIYRQGGLVTYAADAFFLDVLTDTTERSPTFMLPPFKKFDDSFSPRPWAFVKDPFRSTKQAWCALLSREPRGLTWDLDVYNRLNAPEVLRATPPKLDNNEIYKFQIGCEPDKSRTSHGDSALVLIAVGDDAGQLIAAGLKTFGSQYPKTAAMLIGTAIKDYKADELFDFPCDLVSSPLQLWHHIAVKLILNTVSTATMARMGRILGNAMVWVSPTNKKLIDRGCRLISRVTGCSYDKACIALYEAMEEVQSRIEKWEEPPSPVALAIEKLKSA